MTEVKKLGYILKNIWLCEYHTAMTKMSRMMLKISPRKNLWAMKTSYHTTKMLGSLYILALLSDAGKEYEKQCRDWYLESVDLFRKTIR